MDIALEIFGGAPLQSLIGALLFPCDREKAELLTAHLIAQKVAAMPKHALVDTRLSALHRLLAMSVRYPSLHAEVESEKYRATQVGALVAYLWFGRTKGAIWQDAMRGCEVIAGKSRPGSRSAFFAAKKDFSRVLHYLGVLYVEYPPTKGRILTFPRDYATFAAQSMLLLQTMRDRERAGLLGGSAFSSDKIIPGDEMAVPFKFSEGLLPAPLFAPARVGRPLIDDKPMTDAERQRRRRAQGKK